MEESSSQITSKKSWYKTWWGILLLIAFFPFTLSYLAWKQKWPMPARLGAIAVIWIIFIGVGNSSNKNSNSSSTQTNQTASATPSPTQAPQKIEYSLEQKQTDFKTFYAEYQKQGASVVLIQTTLLQMANNSTDKASLYLALDKLSTMQKNLSSASNDIKVPDSLKEYKDLNAAIMELAVAGRHFGNAIDQFMEYLNKNDLSKLKDAKFKSDLGVEQLTSSSNKVEAVAKELEVDTSLLKKNQ